MNETDCGKGVGGHMDFVVRVEYLCRDMINSIELVEEFGGNPMAALKCIIGDEPVSNYADEKKITSCRVAGGRTGWASCGCGDEYPPDSYGAGFIDAIGMCQNCHAARDDEVTELRKFVEDVADQGGFNGGAAEIILSDLYGGTDGKTA